MTKKEKRKKNIQAFFNRREEKGEKLREKECTWASSSSPLPVAP